MSELHAELPEAIRQLLSRVRLELRSALEAQGLQLAAPDAHCLHLVSTQPGISPQEISAQSGYDKAFITRKIRALQDAGFIAKEQDPDDQRRYKLSLTESGETCVRKITDARTAAHSAVFHKLSPGEQATLTHLISKCL